MNSNTQLTPLGWIVVCLALIGFNKSRTGHELIYYGLVLILLFLVVVNYSKILSILTKQQAAVPTSGGVIQSNHIIAN